MHEVIEAAKRFKTCCSYDTNSKNPRCKGCAYYIRYGGIGICDAHDAEDAKLIVDYILSMEDDGK